MRGSREGGGGGMDGWVRILKFKLLKFNWSLENGSIIQVTKSSIKIDAELQ